MLTLNFDQRPEVADRMNALPLALIVQPDIELHQLLADLSPDTPWGTARSPPKIGLQAGQALPGLLAALPVDPFWMVRCAIIQALEIIGDPGAISTLQEVAESDSFQVVCSYAAKAVERLGNRLRTTDHRPRTMDDRPRTTNDGWL